MQLVYGVRLPLETSVEDEIQVAEACLDTFCREAVDIFVTEKCETINLHCLRHLSHQVRHFGPLFVSSAMCFESANRPLVQLFTGTVSQCEVICRRYLENQALLEEEIKNDVLSDVAASWSGQTSFLQSDRTFMQDVLETEYVNAARVIYRESTIFSRALGGNRYFDSLCYRRNCRALNGNVLFEKDGRWECGKIHYFMSLPILQLNTLLCRSIRYRNISKDRTFARSFTSLLLIALKQHSFHWIGWSNSFLPSATRKFGSVKCPILSITNKISAPESTEKLPKYFVHLNLCILCSALLL